MAERKLMHKACDMSEMNKEALICRLFGYFENRESRNESITADDFFTVLQEEVDELTKENSQGLQPKRVR